LIVGVAGWAGKERGGCKAGPGEVVFGRSPLPNKEFCPFNKARSA
jgi:hypothetical protein